MAMNIDFHYGIIYILARFSGLSGPDAEVIAHSSQYVDDATTDGPLKFRDQQSFDRFASAHGMLDYRNALQASDERVWAPFHFLPGARGTTFDERTVCQPDSLPARELINHVLVSHRQSPADNDLHRLGVALHTYVDTWAHQGFSGIISDRNKVTNLVGTHHGTAAHWLGELSTKIEQIADKAKSDVVDLMSGVGHGAALHYPDRPWVKWKYTNGKNQEIERENLPDFIAASNMTYRVIQAYSGNSEAFPEQSGLDLSQTNAISTLLQDNTDVDETKRLEYISNKMKTAGLAGLQEKLPAYIAKGSGSWKHLGTGLTATDDSLGDLAERPAWTPEFEASDYRKVHDAIRQQRIFLTEQLLPKLDIRIA